MATLRALHHWRAQAGTAPQSEYGNLAGFGDRRDPIGQTGRRGKTERPVVPETSRRRERGQRNGSETFGHGRNSDRPPLPRRFFSPLPESAADLPVLGDEFWGVLDAGMRDAEIEISIAARAAIKNHVRLLLAWNAQINLTALRTPEQIARGHVLDSLVAVSALRSLGSESVLDLGSGAGFPGLPLATALPMARLALVDSIGKKARFLAVAAQSVQSTLLEAGQKAPQMTALAERAEDLADEPDHRDGWAMVVARAVGTVAEVAELGLPLVERRGHVVCWKHDSGDGTLDREIAQAARVCQAVGGAAPRKVSLPAADTVGLGGHCLVVIEKRWPTPGRYPRPAAERRRSPLLS